MESAANHSAGGRGSAASASAAAAAAALPLQLLHPAAAARAAYAPASRSASPLPPLPSTPLSLPPLSPCACYFRPWARILVALILVLAAFMIAGNTTTYRIHSWKQTRAAQAKQCAKDVEAGAKGGATQQLAIAALLLASSESADAAALLLATPLPSACLVATQPLPDLILLIPGFTAPARDSDFYARWKGVVDFQPMFWPFLLLLALAWRRDVVRVAETVALEVIILGANGVAHVLVVLPDASGAHAACLDERFAEAGWWIVTRVSSEFCGDMLYSGHTLHTLLALILLYRCVKDETRRTEEEVASDADSHFLSKQAHAFCRSPRARAALLVFFVLCFFVELFGILKIRYHYSLDLFIACLVTLLASTSSWSLELVRCIYKPHIIEELIQQQAVAQSKSAESQNASSCAQLCACCRAEAGRAELTPAATELQLVASTLATKDASASESKQQTAEASAIDVAPSSPPPLHAPAPLAPPDSQLTPAARTVALHLLRGSSCVLRYLSFPTRAAFEASLSRVGN